MSPRVVVVTVRTLVADNSYDSLDPVAAAIPPQVVAAELGHFFNPEDSYAAANVGGWRASQILAHRPPATGWGSKQLFNSTAEGIYNTHNGGPDIEEFQLLQEQVAASGLVYTPATPPAFNRRAPYRPIVGQEYLGPPHFTGTLSSASIEQP